MEIHKYLTLFVEFMILFFFSTACKCPGIFDIVDAIRQFSEEKDVINICNNLSLYVRRVQNPFGWLTIMC